jgi:hypothetical protein
MELLELLGIRVLSSIKLLNLVLESTVCNRTVFCSRLTEKGEIRLKIRKGLLSLPRELSFKVPPYAEIIEDENVRVINNNNFPYADGDGLGFCIYSSNLGSNQEVHEFRFQYTRAIDGGFIGNRVECIEANVSDGNKRVTVKNNSDIELIDYLMKCRMPLPRYVISDFNNFKRMPEEIIKVYDDAGEKKIKISIGKVFMKGEVNDSSFAVNLYGDICWYTNLNPNERKTFEVCGSETKR